MGFLFSKEKEVIIDDDEIQKVKQNSIKDKTVDITIDKCKITITFNTKLLAERWIKYLIKNLINVSQNEKCIDDNFNIKLLDKTVVISIDEECNDNSKFVYNKCVKKFQELVKQGTTVVKKNIYKNIPYNNMEELENDIYGLKNFYKSSS